MLTEVITQQGGCPIKFGVETIVTSLCAGMAAAGSSHDNERDGIFVLGSIEMNFAPLRRVGKMSLLRAEIKYAASRAAGCQALGACDW
jgi:hypothetical protein